MSWLFVCLCHTFMWCTVAGGCSFWCQLILVLQCNPNLQVFNVFVDNIDERLPRIALFSTRSIRAGEELTFDYKMQSKCSSARVSVFKHNNWRIDMKTNWLTGGHHVPSTYTRKLQSHLATGDLPGGAHEAAAAEPLASGALISALFWC